MDLFQIEESASELKEELKLNQELDNLERQENPPSHIANQILVFKRDEKHPRPKKRDNHYAPKSIEKNPDPLVLPLD